jgi:hypothetical protein
MYQPFAESSNKDNPTPARSEFAHSAPRPAANEVTNCSTRTPADDSTRVRNAKLTIAAAGLPGARKVMASVP